MRVSADCVKLVIALSNEKAAQQNVTSRISSNVWTKISLTCHLVSTYPHKHGQTWGTSDHCRPKCDVSLV